MAERKRAQRGKKRERKNVPVGRAHPVDVQQHDRHDQRHHRERRQLGSAGLVGFKGSRKSTPYAAAQTAELAARRAMEHGMQQDRGLREGPRRGGSPSRRSARSRPPA